VAVNICYEDVFGEEIIRQLPEATLLANFTNDAWWGESIASEQHTQMSQMRALETGRYMLRATNTGLTAIIDQRGRVRASVPEFVETALHGSAQGFSGSTPYVRWGNLPFLLLAAAGLLGPMLWSRFGRVR
jgi:apolipoprotein N-acyltransferase